MNLASLSMPDLVGAILGFVLTLFVFSYVLGDNPFFRLAIHIFIGVAAGYAAVVAWYNVIWAQLLLPLMTGSQSQRLLLIVPLLLVGLLLAKISPRLSPLGNPSVGFLVGVGVATAIGGSVLGTLFPQSLATINLFDLGAIEETGQALFVPLANASLILLGTLTTLIYFQFGARRRLNEEAQRPPLVDGLAWIGQIFIAITFGALFAGVFAASLAALIERLNSLIQFLLPLFTR